MDWGTELRRVVDVCLECTDDLKHAICMLHDLYAFLLHGLATFHNKYQYPGA